MAALAQGTQELVLLKLMQGNFIFYTSSDSETDQSFPPSYVLTTPNPTDEMEGRANRKVGAVKKRVFGRLHGHLRRAGFSAIKMSERAWIVTRAAFRGQKIV